jgi:two-component system, LytTR family, response regulator LytT
MNIKCIAIDDEPLALELLCSLIRQTSFLTLEKKFSNAIDALSFINQSEVDLIFLDIQMPDLTGMELARVIEGKKTLKKPKLIFTTAYNQFAIDGYKVDALDYLLKPFSYEDFLKAATKAYHYFEQAQIQASGTLGSPSAAQPDYIFLKVEYQLIKINLRDITHVEAYKDYVKVHLVGKLHPLLSLTSLKSMEELLPSDRFMRVHRSYIVALDHIESISRNVINISNTTIAVSENYKEPFLQFINKWLS